MRLANNSQEELTILNVPHIGSLVFLDSDKIFFYKELGKETRDNIHAALICRDFVKFDVLTNQKSSRDNSKVVTFFAF